MLARFCPAVVLSLSVLTWLCNQTAAAAPLRSLPVAAHQQGADAPAHESRTPAVVLGSKDERVTKATENYANNRPVEAALGFEGLWKDFPAEPDFLFNAAAARFAARHFAHAIAYTREYLALSSVTPQDRQGAEAQLADALKQTVSVSVTVSVEGPSPTGAVTLVAEHLARESGDVRPHLLFPANPGVVTELQLDPGMWSLRAQAAGHAGDERRVQVVAGQPLPATVRLWPRKDGDVKDPVVPQPTLPREVPPETVRGLKLGFGIGGGIVAAGGVAALVAGVVKTSTLRECNHVENANDCVKAFARGHNIRDAGTLGLGLGLGLVAGGLPWLSKDAKMRRNVWIAEAVVGGVGFVAGLIAMPYATRSFNSANTAAIATEGWQKHFEAYRHSPGHAVTTTLIGFGAGALVSAAVGLIVQHRNLNGVRVDASVGAGRAGLVVVGRF